MKKTLALIMALVMVFPMLSITAEEKNMLSREEIPLYNGGGLDRIGILKGTEKGFELEREVTRAEALTFIMRALAMDEEGAKASPFTDVKGHWAEKTVDLFYEKGFVNGISETLYAPDRTVTGQEFTKILLSAMGYSGISLENALEKGDEYDVLSNNFTKSVVKQNFTLLRSDVLRIIHSALSAKCADGVMTYEKHIEKGLLEREDFYGVLWCGTPAAKPLSFADKFYNKIESEESYMVSPFSVKIALLLLANGAEGETKAEILDLLGVDDLSAYNEEMKTLAGKYAMSKSFTLNTANSVWMNKDNTNQNFSDIYKETVSNYYNAEVMKTDNKTAVKTVNDWVSDKTNGKIKSLIQKPDFYALLVNAVYFKASWQNEFNKG
ncbi:MAG: serpin family protein, partial [Clostridia bacterium]|nr:serpin family protein [Clostridia bacterium]